MSDWIKTFDAVFFISIATMLTSLIALIIKHCLKSKCETCSLCWGLITIKRRVDLEVQEELQEIEIGRNKNNSSKEETKNNL